MIKLRLAYPLALLSTLLALVALPIERAQPAPFDPEHPYTVKDDGTVDWYTYSGYRRYHSDCHVCHGPDGLGSTYAPALSKTLQTTSYPDFANVVVNGRKNVSTAQESVMPGFGTNRN